jgi:hypothetical protein
LYNILHSIYLFSYYHRHASTMTPRKAKLYPHIWKHACDGICSRIQGYSDLLRDNKTIEAESIYNSASLRNFKYQII